MYETLRTATDIKAEYVKDEFDINDLRPEHYFDCTLTDTADPAKPMLKMQNDQVIGDEWSVFGYQYGDGKILAVHSPMADQPSTFNSCQKFAQLWVLMYVKDFSTTIGYMGYFYNILEWVSEEEAEEMMREGV